MRMVALVVVLAVGLLAAPLPCEAQPGARVFRIGVLGAASASAYAGFIEAFRQGLRELGYVEGKSIAIEYRWAEGQYERLPDLAAELVRVKVDLIVTHGTPGTRAAKEATSTIPIVMAIVGDAVATGLVARVVRPGGNITGSSFFFPELVVKRLELLKEAAPKVTRVAVLLNPGNPAHGPVIQAMEPAARLLKVELQQFAVGGPNEIESAFSAMVKRRADALAVIDDAMLIAHARRIAELAVKNRMPSVGLKEHADAGGLMAYGVDSLDGWRHAAVFVDKILKGAKPGDLPVEQPTKFELVINLKTAKALGLALPQSILIRADHVIQ